MESNLKHLAFLDGLRGVLAFYVLCVHFVGETVDGLSPVIRQLHFLFHFGHVAVGFFIVLSGYSLMLPVAHSVDHHLRGGLGGYFLRRARRILPPYYAALGLSIAILLVVRAIEGPEPTTMHPDELSLKSILSHVLLIHTLVGDNLTINRALWSVATEWHIYFLFPTILLPVWRRFGLAALLAVSFALGTAPLLFLPPGSALLAACPWYLGLFALGMAGAAVRGSPKKSLVERPAALALVLIGALLLYVAVQSLGQQGDAGTGYTLLCLEDVAVGVAAWCLLIYCAQRTSARVGGAQQPPVLLQLFESRPAVLLGGFSYSLYATHCAVLTAFDCFNQQLHLAPMPAFLVRILVGVPVALATAWGFSVWFEAPFLKTRAARVEPAGGGLRLQSSGGEV